MTHRIATYRIQFRPEFAFDQAESTVPYLNRLGVSHLYASPFTQAAPGSTHGYDVVDYTRVNSALGGPSGLERLSAALATASMGMVLDLVPNHMAIHPANPWWWDVLENGPSSRYAAYFDVEWDPPEARHANAVLVPVLGDHYGRILDAGEIQIVFDGADFTVEYHENIYPVDPASLGPILSAAAEHAPGPSSDIVSSTLAFLSGVHSRLPDAGAVDQAGARRRYRDAGILRGLLARLVRDHPEAGQAIDETLATVNADPDALDAFLRRQNYRLALWKISARELGYRRFFDINTMIGMRMEAEEVYKDAHALALELIQRGVIDGLRIDHPDGLLDPQQYFSRLRQSAEERGRPDTWVVIEKILEPGERLPEDWPVQGTTGYDYLNRLNGALVDRRAEAALTEFYTRFTGQTADYHALVLEKKRQAASDVLGSDLSRLTELFLQVCERHREYRDYTRSELNRTLAETAACLPVYRTYVCPDVAGGAASVSPDDQAHIQQAIEQAKANRPELDPRLFDFLRDLLFMEYRGAVEEELVRRFQQFTGPVMAKGVEDTVFYLYNRFISLNEVGGDPGRFGVTPAEFHQANAEAQERWPLTMLTTSTHDTKRSEDVRARLNVLSEQPGLWMEAVMRWAKMNEPYRTPAAEATPTPGDCSPTDDGYWPDRNAEYLLYQTLAGAWPIEPDRVVEYMRKAGREAKAYTTWTAPNGAYEEAVEGFIREVLDDHVFTADLEALVTQIDAPGRVNAIAQALLKLTSPGIPDIYQGSEVWNFALVDPDNRRPVDYDAIAAMLEGLRDDSDPAEILAAMDSGLPKLWVTRQALALRARRPEAFDASGSYTALEVRMDGAEAQDEEPPALAYLRGSNVLVAAPRLTTRFRPMWGQAVLRLPEGRWRSLLSHETFPGGPVTLEALFGRFPAALLERES
jgi:(1->4)-alpha-D-glucan 1-alpha-D-glucosylmutase